MAMIEDPRGREAAMLERLVTFGGQDVLDVGCGTGRTARWIARTAAAVTGLDPDRERIAQARAAPAEAGSCAVTYVAGDVLALGLPDASFDAVVFSRSL